MCTRWCCSTCWTICGCSCACSRSAISSKCWCSSRSTTSTTCTSSWTWCRSTRNAAGESDPGSAPFSIHSRATWPLRASTIPFCTAREVRRHTFYHSAVSIASRRRRRRLIKIFFSYFWCVCAPGRLRIRDREMSTDIWRAIRKIVCPGRISDGYLLGGDKCTPREGGGRLRDSHSRVAPASYPAGTKRQVEICKRFKSSRDSSVPFLPWSKPYQIVPASRNRYRKTDFNLQVHFWNLQVVP